MACSMSSSVVWGSCSCPAAGLRRVSSVSSFRCGLEQLESGIAPPHSAIHSPEDLFRRWRASCVPVQTQVAKDKAACQRREAFGVSRRSLLGLLAVALTPAVALAEEEVENESQRLFRQMKTSVVERVEKRERERAVVGAAAPPPSTLQEPVPTADASPEAELEPETEPELELTAVKEPEPSEAYAAPSEETLTAVQEPEEPSEAYAASSEETFTAVQEPEPSEAYAASSEETLTAVQEPHLSEAYAASLEETPQAEEEASSPGVVAAAEEPQSSSESSETSTSPVSYADPIVPPADPIVPPTNPETVDVWEQECGDMLHQDTCEAFKNVEKCCTKRHAKHC